MALRARANLDSLGVTNAGPGRGWAIGGWLIPVVNLVVPFRVTATVARASLPRTTALEVMLWTWWLAWVCRTGLELILGSVDTAAYEALPARCARPPSSSSTPATTRIRSRATYRAQSSQSSSACS
ncbi:DUF4328 domain-containing protein [Phytohabitans kaempferiae]|uniref:DUF4328 domain-containing protein n=1 Tax=Phytohabitans kaempferiae TaxID=1620943 RepID=A0ABV6LX90_9ACTN